VPAATASGSIALASQFLCGYSERVPKVSGEGAQGKKQRCASSLRLTSKVGQSKNGDFADAALKEK
jgi:hypothetical protein